MNKYRTYATVFSWKESGFLVKLFYSRFVIQSFCWLSYKHFIVDLAISTSLYKALPFYHLILGRKLLCILLFFTSLIHCCFLFIYFNFLLDIFFIYISNAIPKFPYTLPPALLPYPPTPTSWPWRSPVTFLWNSFSTLKTWVLCLCLLCINRRNVLVVILDSEWLFSPQMCVKGVRNTGKGIIWSKTDCTEMPGSKLSSFQEPSEWVWMSPVHGGWGEPSSLFCGHTGNVTFKTVRQF